MNKAKQSGFAILHLVLFVVVLAIIGFAGYKVYQVNKDSSETTPETTQNTNNSSDVTDVATAPEVNTASDLDTALEVLDETDPSGSNVTDADAIDAEMIDF